MPPAAVPRRIGLFLAVVQFFFALTWTVYVVYLPALAAKVGIPASAVVWLLMLDQLVFLCADYACGVASDRMARLNGRFGPAVLAATLLSCAAFLALPWVAPSGSAPAFIALTVVWAITASALRAPPMNLIGRYTPLPRQPGLLALSMLGMGLAAAIAPYLGSALRDIDPRWPFLLASLALAGSTIGIVAAERVLQKAAQAGTASTLPAAGAGAGAAPSPPQPSPDATTPGPQPPWPLGLLVVVLAALAFQLHVFLNSGPLYLRHAPPSALQDLLPVFWVGFNLGLWPASLATRRWGGVRVIGLAGLLAAASAGLALIAPALGGVLVAQALAGLAWAAVLMSAFAAALALGHTGQEGRFSGALSSLLALASLLRMATLAAGSKDLAAGSAARLALDWAPVVMWALAGSLTLLVYAAHNRRASAGHTARA